MEQDVEIVGVTGRNTAAPMGGVTGISEFEELRYTGREWGFERLHAGEDFALARDEVIEVMAFNGVRGGQESWSLLRIRAGRDSRLTGPLSWRRVPNPERWSPAPAEATILTNWVKISAAAFVVVFASYAIFAWALEGILSGGLATTLSSATVSVAVIVGAVFFLMRSFRSMAVARRIARIQAEGSMFVVGQPEGY
ncbi:hypothetical protein ATO8_19034 [Roseivivax marinus]|uniref:Uncharacterized protein n=1 Tax=Roseivivax marinus TaxID=1379903 RepID=W4HF60_9RHOB|nr:hypothetical protein [Roseivivax marinus]ETW11033.1 hypothetical protein ATO8_19034 [Roseivivax marinus]UMA66917.1 hypothetical protein LVO79_20345 [Roseivivax marinus]